jgi:endonuclease/exonuclease/phosphatase family metal-dependent hydrolase
MVAEANEMKALVVSRAAQHRRAIAVMARGQILARDIKYVFAQQVTVAGLDFIHVHVPAGSYRQEERERLFRRIEQDISEQGNPPILVGDFNCVIDKQDTELWDAHKHSENLS